MNQTNGFEDEEDDEEVPILISVQDDDGSISESAVPPLKVNHLSDDTSLAAELQPPQDQVAHAQVAPPQPPCPVTILTGFLGSGKTTLVQYILQSPDHGKRIAVIENEFADSDSGNDSPLSIESMIAKDGLTSNSLQEFIELPNGCICCTVKDSLVITLERLLEKRSDLDYILIECSGLANPGPIASIFWLDDALESRLQLDGIVTLVDAVHIEQQLAETMEASQQVAYADRILLNKIDLLPPHTATADVDRLQRLLRTIHPTAAIQCTTYAAVPDLDWILNAHCFTVPNAQDVMSKLEQRSNETAVVPSNTASLVPSPLSPPCGHAHHGNQNDVTFTCGICHPESTTTTHIHTAGVSTVTLSIPGTVHVQKVHQWLASILGPSNHANASATNEIEPVKSNQNEEQQIFRLKGILSVWFDDDNEDTSFRVPSHCTKGADKSGLFLDRRRFIVQGVYDLWDIHACTSTDLFWNADTDATVDNIDTERCSKLIVIGRHLNVAELQAGFQKCV
jgi:G3E family GTPase